MHASLLVLHRVVGLLTALFVCIAFGERRIVVGNVAYRGSACWALLRTSPFRLR